jgi:hypothetical protein
MAEASLERRLLIVPDNLLALVAQANRYEPKLTESTLDFARHYGCSVLPARAYHQRVPRLAEELRIRHANGTFTRWLDTLKNTDVLLLDDWGMAG